MLLSSTCLTPKPLRLNIRVSIQPACPSDSKSDIKVAQEEQKKMLFNIIKENQLEKSHSCYTVMKDTFILTYSRTESYLRSSF